MKIYVKLVVLVFISGIFGAFVSSELEPANDCAIVHEGTFNYQGEAGIVKVVINGKKHTEYHNDGKYYIKSKIEWVNECEYNMTIQKVNIPDFPFGKGDIMNVKITSVKGKNVYYTSKVNGSEFNGMMTKVK